VALEAANHCGSCEWCRKGQTNLCPQVRFCGMPGVDGALREFMAWPAHLLYKLPQQLDFDDGVLAEVLGIGLHSIDLAKMRAGMTAAVLGAGPVGLGIVHLLRRTAGVGLVLASEPIAERRTAALRLGADEVIDAFRENVVERVITATRGRGVDVVFEAAGVAETCEQSVQIAAPGGKVVFVGIPEDDRCPFVAGPARRKGLTFRFIRRSLATYPRVLSLMEKGIIDARPMITHHFSLENVQQAFELADGYGDGVLKAVIRVGAEKQRNSWD
jgi:L-iditol 2-dehydrogenase